VGRLGVALILLTRLSLFAEKKSLSAMSADSQQSPVTLLTTPTKLSKAPPLGV